MSDESDKKQPENQLVKRLAVGATGSVVGGSVLAAVLLRNSRTIVVFLLTAIIVAAVVGGLYLLWRARKRKRRNKEFEDDVTREFDKQSESSSDHDQKARLDQMKRKFMLLIERLRAEGHQNIYDMPWYLTIGPSGTGKSWVLKAGGLDPLEESDWKKGTFLIDWWTCDDALVLDTAGGLVFGEDKGYETPDWKSLLELIRKYRPQCPVNGIFVVIPSQLLWLEPDEIPAGWLSLEDYAEALRIQIRKQLQRTLGVRFPIYLLVTQSDRLPGFREFADALEANGTPCGQMLGWSNPVDVGQDENQGRFRGGADRRGDPESEPIKEIADRLGQVVGDLSRQRLTLLNKYAGESARTDEVGMSVRQRAAELFTFPDAIQSTLAPRLQQFLETVFRPDRMLPKPPYLRGIYFTSALREGEVLDRQRAQMGGKKLADLALPGGADRRQPKPFFLKDLFYEKAFLEAWLVTPLIEAARFLKQRRRALIWSGIGATAVLLVAIGIGGVVYSRTVGTELEEWNKARGSVNLQERYWLPVVKPGSNGLEVVATNLITHENLAKSARGRTEGAGFWSFDWLFSGKTLEKRRREAQLKLFERGVILPLAEYTVIGMLSATNATTSPVAGEIGDKIRRFEGALLGVLELNLCPVGSLNEANLPKSGERVLNGYVNYLLPDEANGARTLASLRGVFDTTFADKPRRETWPQTNLVAQFFTNNFVGKAFQQLKNLYNEETAQLNTRKTDIENLVRNAKGVRESEEKLVQAIERAESRADLLQNLHALQTNWDTLREGLKPTNTLQQTFDRFSSEVTNSLQVRQKRLRQQLAEVNGTPRPAARAGILTTLTNVLSGKAPAATNSAGKTNIPDIVLIEPLERELRAMASAQPDSIARLVSFESWKRDAAELDRRWIAPVQEGQSGAEFRRLFDQRLDLYAKAIAIEFTTQFLRDLERDFVEEKSRLNSRDVIDSIDKLAVRAWEGLPGNVVTGLNLRNIGYSAVLSNHVVYRYFEQAIGSWERSTTNLLNSDTWLPNFSENRKPKDMMGEVESANARLQRLDDLWGEFNRRWRDVGSRNYGPIDRGRNAVKKKREDLFAEVENQIMREAKAFNNKGFPLDGTGKVALETEVTDSSRRANLWSEAIKNPTGDPNTPSRIKSGESENCARRVQDWQERFKQLLDEKGQLLDYEVTSPWAEPEKLEKALGVARAQTAKTDAGAYRHWNWNRKWIEADDIDVKKTARMTAAEGFHIEARTSRATPEKMQTRIDTVLQPDAWTIIGLLRLRETVEYPKGSGRYYVPIEVDGDKKNAKVWFVVRQQK